MMRIRVTSMILVLVCTANGLRAQQGRPPRPLARATTVDWLGLVSPAPGTSSRPRLAIQCGFQVSLIGFESEGQKVETQMALPVGAFMWDLIQPSATAHRGRIVAVMGRSVVVGDMPEGNAKSPSFRRIGSADGLFRGRLSSPPLARRFTASDAEGRIDYVLPTLGGLSWSRGWTPDGKPAEVVRLSSAVKSEQSLGWGIGYRMTSRLTVPFFRLTDVDGDGRRDLLVKNGGQLQAQSGQTAWAYGRTTTEQNSEILGFDHKVEPLVCDYDHDGKADVIIVDPGRGSVFVYCGARRKAAEEGRPDQVLKLAGWLFWRWMIDVNGDGRDDLVLLGVPKLNLLSQVGVVRKKAIPVELTVRLQLEDGRFSTSTELSRSMSLPTIVSLTRNKRATRFRAPITPYRDAKGRFTLIAPGEDGDIVVDRWQGKDWQTVATLGPAVGEDHWYASPFEPLMADVDGDGEPDPAFIIKSGEGDRAVIHLSR